MQGKYLYSLPSGRHSPKIIQRTQAADSKEMPKQERTSNTFALTERWMNNQ
jgi:hypothetical protein